MSSQSDTSTPTDEWFSDDTFWEASYGVMFPDERFDGAAAELDAVLRLVGQTPERVLDVACGPGRHAVDAARRGATVVGVDRSAFLLDKARRLAEREGVEVEWVHADMRDHVQGPPVDLVLNLFTSFGYFADDADNARVLENAHRSLRPGGSLVVDVMGKEVLARIFSPSTVLDGPGGMVVQRRRAIDDWSRMENEWTFVQEGSVRVFEHVHWIYSGRELAQMLARAGFTDVDLFGDFEGAPYGSEASRLVAVARKA
ncbi:class I SAM-dependent methyltransferase [Rubrivirga sp.]|uniref:class I SAM-dependent methyltransferase n=1 Tax=Rubrivirga sp. TaxID=1885344 RepID=UPI003B528F29